MVSVPAMGVSEHRGTLLGGPFKGTLFYFTYQRGTRMWEDTHMLAHLGQSEACFDAPWGCCASVKQLGGFSHLGGLLWGSIRRPLIL